MTNPMINLEKINPEFKYNVVFKTLLTNQVENLHAVSHFKNKAWFKRRILHAPNRIAKLNACKMRLLNQLNAAHFNSMKVSRIFD